MKIFENIDREQAEMYRWIRRNMSAEQFSELTGRELGEFSSALDVDRELREAFVRQRAAEFAKIHVDASKVRMGLLPPALGNALREYSEEYAAATSFREGLSGCSHSDMDSMLRLKFLNLCDEISKLRF